MTGRLRWGAILLGFCVTAIGILVVAPLLTRLGLQVSAGPVDMLTMLSILVGGFVAGRLARRTEGMHGAVVAVLYIFGIWLTKQVLDEVHVANALGLKALGSVDSWSNFGKDFFYFVAGALGGLWATPLNAREQERDNALLRSATTRRSPAAPVSDVIARDDAPAG